MMYIIIAHYPTAKQTYLYDLIYNSFDDAYFELETLQPANMLEMYFILPYRETCKVNITNTEQWIKI